MLVLLRVIRQTTAPLSYRERIKSSGIIFAALVMMFFRFTILLFLFSTPLSVSALSYSWPLEQNYGISATFGESRGDHFHAGIDLSTNGDIGMPVLAVAEGAIYRLKVQKRGYGKAVYIRHPDGIVSVYAHLDRYSSDLGLEQAYERRVTQTGNRYTGDIFIDPPIQVQKGTLIAYSGETGAGLPHLHLELRREENTPINPLSNAFQDDSDPVPPAFQAIYLYPANAASAIDGEMDTKTVKLEGEAGVYKADHLPVVHGDFFMSVSVYDSALRPYRRVPHRMQLSVDGRLISQIEFDQFSYSEDEGFGLIYDQGKPGASYHELPIVMSNAIDFATPFVRKFGFFSANVLTPGKHRLELQAADAQNNTSIAVMDFMVNQPPQLQFKNIMADAGDLIVEATIEDSDWKQGSTPGFAGEVEYSLDNGQTFVSFPQNTVHLDMGHGSARLLCRAPLASLGKGRLLIKARGYDGLEYSPYRVTDIPSTSAPALSAMLGIPRGDLKVKPYGNSIRVTYDTKELITYPLQIQTSSGNDSYPLQSWNLSSYYSAVPVSPAGENITVMLTGGSQMTIPVHYAKAGQISRIAKEEYELTFGADSLFKDSFIWPITIPAYTTRYLYFVGPILEIGPRGLPLKKSAELRFHYPSGTARPERLSIYRWNRFSQRWESLPSTVNVSSRTVQTRISYLDLYALLYDNVAPVITQIFPRRNSVTRNNTPKLAAQVRDAGMDINDEKISFYVDGVRFPAEYDPDRNIATLQIERPLKNGTHSFRVVAEDWAKNRTESKKVYFRVK